MSSNFLGDIELAVCGGVNVMQLPATFVALCKARMLSRTSRSMAFSTEADGYVRGEGCGVVILKRLKQVSEQYHIYILQIQ